MEIWGVSHLLSHVTLHWLIGSISKTFNILGMTWVSCTSLRTWLGLNLVGDAWFVSYTIGSYCWHVYCWCWYDCFIFLWFIVSQLFLPCFLSCLMPITCFGSCVGMCSHLHVCLESRVSIVAIYLSLVIRVWYGVFYPSLDIAGMMKMMMMMVMVYMNLWSDIFNSNPPLFIIPFFFNDFSLN